MPDIRTVLAALDEEDRRLWSQHRTEMRRSYMTAHNSVIGVAAWNAHDDAFLDLIDIKLALIFDNAGRFAAVNEVANKADGAQTEAAILKADDQLKVAKPTETASVVPVAMNDDDPSASNATQMMRNGWAVN